MQQVVKAVNEQGLQGSKEHLLTCTVTLFDSYRMPGFTTDE